MKIKNVIKTLGATAMLSLAAFSNAAPYDPAPLAGTVTDGTTSMWAIFGAVGAVLAIGFVVISYAMGVIKKR